LGRQIALELAGAGWDIALHYHKSEIAAKKVKQEIILKGRQCHIFKADLSIPDITSGLLDDILNKFPDLLLIVNNASIFSVGRLSETSIEQFNTNLNIHLISPFNLIRHFTEKQKSGQIINILDTKISENDVSRFAYNLSKKSLAELTRMAALEYAPEFRVNAISPGAVLPPGDNPQIPAGVIKCNPMKKIVSVSSIMQSILFLTENADITGQIITIDGGQNLK